MSDNKILRLLLVDDERMNTLILAKRLKKEGFLTTEAFDGQEAVHLASMEPRPDIILMDLMMPKMDGWEATTVIKKQFPDIKILAVSAKTDEEQRILEQGFDGFCPKPINFRVLIKKISTLSQ